MESPPLLLVSDVSDSGHVPHDDYFLYMNSHLGFVIAIFKPKFYNHCFSSCFAVVTGVPRPPAVTQSVGETAPEKRHVLYITWR